MINLKILFLNHFYSLKVFLPIFLTVLFLISFFLQIFILSFSLISKFFLPIYLSLLLFLSHTFYQSFVLLSLYTLSLVLSRNFRAIRFNSFAHLKMNFSTFICSSRSSTSGTSVLVSINMTIRRTHDVSWSSS